MHWLRWWYHTHTLDDQNKNSRMRRKEMEWRKDDVTEHSAVNRHWVVTCMMRCSNGTLLICIPHRLVRQSILLSFSFIIEIHNIWKLAHTLPPASDTHSKTPNDECHASRHARDTMHLRFTHLPECGRLDATNTQWIECHHIASMLYIFYSKCMRINKIDVNLYWPYTQKQPTTASQKINTFETINLSSCYADVSLPAQTHTHTHQHDDVLPCWTCTHFANAKLTSIISMSIPPNNINNIYE